MMKRLCASLLAIVAWASGAAAVAGPVPPVSDLRDDAAAARTINGALLVLFMADYCGYCERVLRDFLVPMSKNAGYRNRVVMRRLVTSDTAEIVDFDGRRVAPRDFSDRYGHSLVPTVMLFDHGGRVLAKPLVGLGPVDYYGHYLDQAIDEAVGKVRTPLALAPSAAAIAGGR